MFNEKCLIILVRRAGLEPATNVLIKDNPIFCDPYGVSYEQGKYIALPLSYRRIITYYLLLTIHYFLLPT